MVWIRQWQRRPTFEQRLGINFTVEAGQAYPQRFYQWIDYFKKEAIYHSGNYC